MALTAHKTGESGFVGAVSGMSLADIVQVKSGNRYSGCLIVEHLNNCGTVFFREGDVVHAEQGALSGEAAFYAIMSWVGGTFRSEPKVSTTSRTIDQSLGYLVLEALRRMDESGGALHGGQPHASGSGAGAGDIGSRLREIAGVEQALVMTKDGAIGGGSSYQDELLGANGLYLAHFAGQLGSCFGFSDLKSATVHGSERHLFLFDSRRHHLCVSAGGDGNVNAIDSEIRRTLTKKTGN